MVEVNQILGEIRDNLTIFYLSKMVKFNFPRFNQAERFYIINII